MRIDELDNTLVCDNEDYNTILSYFKEYRVLPNYIEKSILKIILRHLLKKPIMRNTIDEYMELIPDEFIRKAIFDINTMFNPKLKSDYSRRHFAYLLYYLPANVFKIWKPLLDLQLRNTLKPHMRILDIGTGPASVPLGIIEYYKTLADSYPNMSFTLDFTLIEAEKEFLDIAENILFLAADAAPSNLAINIEKMICATVSKDSDFNNLNRFDLITMSNFLNINEGENYTNSLPIIVSLKDCLKDDGSMIVIEPGEEESCKYLKRIRNTVVNEKVLNVFSPCIGLWEEKKRYNCECFSMTRCFWKLPHIFHYLVSKGLHKAKRIDVPFNYVVFRKDDIKKYDILQNAQYFVKLKDLNQHIGETVNIIALIRSVIDNKNALSINLCDGSCSFSKGSPVVWIKITKEQLRNFGINTPLISAERITIKKAFVSIKGNNYYLQLKKDTRIMIDY